MGDQNFLHGSLFPITGSKVVSIFRSAFRVCFSFELFFALFLFAGVFKGNPRLSWIPVDLAVLGFVFSGLGGLLIIIRGYRNVNPSTLKILIVPLFFFLWAILSLNWSNCWDYGGRKALQLFVVGFWGFTGAAVIIGRDEQRLLKFFGVIFIFSVWMAIEFVGLLMSGGILAEWVFSSNYLGFGRLLGLSVIIIVGMLIWGGFRSAFNVVLGLVAVFLISILMISGGRGPLVATLAAMIVPIVSNVRFFVSGLAVKKNLVVFIAMLAVVLVGFVKIGNQFFGFTTIDRFLALLEAGGGGSAQKRLWFFEKSWELFLDSPIIGHGIGSFGFQIGWGDVRVYPHNIVLETMVELGVVGLILLIAVVLSSTRRFSLNLIRNDVLSAVLVMFLINSIFNAFVSGDLTDNRLVFVFLGLCAGRFQGGVEPHVKEKLVVKN